ncbi:MAG: glycosyltransferase family 2 protein, partial [Armatimonadetes bacterium]|nr:glycosyltransferase family 2 protein [Armatimonadota bacterium]
MALQSWAWLLVVGGTSVLAYVLLGYPLLLALRARLAPRPVAVDTSFEPSLSILISAYCEARDLPGKLASLWRLDYPPQQLEVLMADDGSADDTALV